jgi:hypothetical protein
MRTVTRLGAVALLLMAGIVGWTSRPGDAGGAVEIARRVEVEGATPDQLELVRWAVGRFEAAGLDVPAVDVEFHADRSGCGSHTGFARGREVDVCTTLVNAMTRRVLLHEMSHIWLDQHTDASTRAAFLRTRGLSSWNSSDDEWRNRGYEQGAEIIARAIGERILTAQIPDHEPAELDVAFDLLTGIALPS